MSREGIQSKLNKEKTKIFREIGYLAKKLYRATREEYKHDIKTTIEEAITLMAEKIVSAREELAEIHEETFNEQSAIDEQDKATYI